MHRLAPRNPGARRRCLRRHPKERVGSLPSQLRPESMNREHASWETPSWSWTLRGAAGNVTCAENRHMNVDE